LRDGVMKRSPSPRILVTDLCPSVLQSEKPLYFHHIPPLDSGFELSAVSRDDDLQHRKTQAHTHTHTHTHARTRTHTPRTPRTPRTPHTHIEMEREGGRVSEGGREGGRVERPLQRLFRKVFSL